MIFMVDSTATLKDYAFTCIRCGCCCYQTKGIDMTEREWKAIGPHPFIVPLEGDSSSLYRYRILPLDSGKCPFLENNLCTIYDKRPEICRRVPLTMRYVPDIGYLYSTIICCGAHRAGKPSPFPFEGYTETLDQKFLSLFERLENRNSEAAFAVSKPVKISPLVTDMETVITVWDYIGDLAYTDILRRENLQWMSWVIMKVWYQFYLDVLQKEEYVTTKTIPRIQSLLKKLFNEYAKSQLDQLEEVKEKAAYRSDSPRNDSHYVLFTCKRDLKTLNIPVSDEERSYSKFTEEALEFSRNYYSFLARRTVRASPFRSFVVPIAFVPEILHRTVTDLTGSAVLLAKHRGHSIITGDDLFDVIKLQDDPRKVHFYTKQVLESYGVFKPTI